MAEIKLKKREEMDPAYCWDLSSLFASDAAFEETERKIEKKIETFRSRQGTMKESAEALYRVLSDLDEISRVFSSLYVYASQKYHQDMGNQKCRKDGQHDGGSRRRSFLCGTGNSGAR